MNFFSIFIALLLAFYAVSSASHAQDETPVPEGPYVGQRPPGLTPEVFAPGIVSKEHRDLSGFFTPDMKEFYFTRKDLDSGKWWLVVFQQKDNGWHESIAMPRVGRPLIAPNGKVMHLGKHYMEQTDHGWSEIKSLGPLFEGIRIMRLSASSKGTYILDEAGVPNGDGVIRYSRLVDGKREVPKPLGKEINTGKWNAHPFIAPDETYIIWDGERDSGLGDGDLYISFRKPDGSWGEAIHMGDKINTSASESGASVTPDGKYLFFNRMVDREAGNADIFWVDAQVIEDLRPKY